MKAVLPGTTASAAADASARSSRRFTNHVAVKEGDPAVNAASVTASRQREAAPPDNRWFHRQDRHELRSANATDLDARPLGGNVPE